jgi:methylphosphotriester-DNA--protein-cysteine methyltransferase
MSANVRPLARWCQADVPRDELDAWLAFKEACHRIGLAAAVTELALVLRVDESTVRRWYRANTRLPAGALRAAERIAAGRRAA